MDEDEDDSPPPPRQEHGWENDPDSEIPMSQDNQSPAPETSLAAKRGRGEAESSEEEFVSAVKRKSKRYCSAFQNNSLTIPSNGIEVCVSSFNALPKQMAFAKLLRNENICNVVQIRYKSPFKVLLKFEKKEEAEKLLCNKKFQESGFKAQFTTETSVVYGVIKGVEIDMAEPEILKVLESSAEILSVRRLKRLSADGSWVESETIRVCFKGNSLPQSIYAYGCRFKVEPYNFPVTQCAGCWKFGHMKKFCPIKKVLCPKCGGSHVNCEITDFKCLNCKGPHFTLDKSCPVFRKEKDIRRIMSEKLVTYRKALELYLESQDFSALKSLSGAHTSSKNQDLNPGSVDIINSGSSGGCVMTESYSSVLKRGFTDNKEPPQVISPKSPKSWPTSQRRPLRSEKSLCTDNGLADDLDLHIFNSDNQGASKMPKEAMSNSEKRERRSKFDFCIFFTKIKNIITSSEKLVDKLVAVCKCILEELKVFLFDLFSGGDFIIKLFNFFNG